MAPKAVGPLGWNVPIADAKTGMPTPEFQRKFLEQQAANSKIKDLTTSAAISALLDLIGSAPGDILYRDAKVWKVLTPGTVGYILRTEGTAAPQWNSISAILDGIGATQGDILYRNGTVWTVLPPGTDGQSLVYDGTAHAPKWSSSGGVILGSGVPASLQPAGTLYSRTDTAGLYVSTPTNVNTSVAQHTSTTGSGGGVPGSISLPAAPTAGNLLIAFLSWGNGNSAAPTVNTAKWTQFDTIPGNPGSTAGFCLYRYVQAGDTAALPAFCIGSSGAWAAAVYEITSVSGTFATDVQVSEGNWQATVASLTTSNENTASNNALALLFGAQYVGFGATANPTFSAGWTSDESQHNNGNYGSIAAAHQSVPASGTGVSGTVTYGATLNSTAAQVIVAGSASLVAGWTFIGPEPLASSTVFGLAKVDGATISATAGVIGVKALPGLFQARLTANMNPSSGVWTKALLDTVDVDTLGGWVSASHWYKPPAGTYLVSFTATLGDATTSTFGFALVSMDGLHGSGGDSPKLFCSVTALPSAPTLCTSATATALITTDGTHTFELDVDIASASPVLFGAPSQLDTVMAFLKVA